MSGGQTGVDTGALRAALNAGAATGGWCPPDRRNESGLIPEEFNLKPTPAERSERAPDIPRSMRTEWNVRDAEGTLLFTGPGEDPGSRWTRICAKQIYRKPLLIITPEEADSDSETRIKKWLLRFNIGIMNVAGPPASIWPSGENVVFSLLIKIINS